MPKYLMKDVTQSSKEIMDQELSTNDINQSYEDNLGDENSTEASVDQGF
jgi:hypothetical protein